MLSWITYQLSGSESDVGCTPRRRERIMFPSEGSDENGVLLIGEILYAAAAWDALSALGTLRVRSWTMDDVLTRFPLVFVTLAPTSLLYSTGCPFRKLITATVTATQ